MSDLLTEVDEMMRQERIVKLWQDHGNTLIGIIVAIILGTAGSSGYQAWDKAQRTKSTNILLDTLNAEDFPENVDPETLDIRSGAKGIALLKAAAEFLTAGETETSLSLYRDVMNNKSIPDDLAQIAKLKVTALSNDSAADKIDILNSIIIDEDSPWRYQALLQRAVIEANETNDFAKAIASLEVILKAQNLSNTLYAKAQSLSQIYRLKLNASAS